MSTSSTTEGGASSGRASSLAWKITLLLIPLLTITGLFALRQAQVNQAARRNLPNYGPAPTFELIDQNAQPFGSQNLQGKVWIAGFIFTTCPGPCPIISSRMADLQKPLEGTGAQLVTVTVDPETDTPPVLREYAQRLGADTSRWHFLTGSKEKIYDVVRQGFKMSLLPGEPETGPIHATRLILVDSTGSIRGYYDALAPDAIAKLAADAGQLARKS